MRPDIETERLHIRCFRDEDAAALAPLAGDPDVARMTMRVPSPYPVEAAEAWIFLANLRHQACPNHVRAVTLRGGPLVGAIGVFKRAPADADYELGYWIGKPYWGRGLAGEAARAVIDAAREDLGCARLTAGYFADNPASRRVQAKLGFEPTGTTRLVYSIGRGASAACIDMALSLLSAPATTNNVESA